MQKSIKVNYFYNLLLTISGLLFPLITFPYISRVLGASGVGVVQFNQSIIDYIILFSSLGIPIYGIREIARVRDDYEQQVKTSLEILILHLLLTIFAYGVALMLSVTIDRLGENLHIFFILSLCILLNTIGCNWFFSGIEDFKYITIRALCVRILSIIFLFLFVKTKEDLTNYAIYSLISTSGHNIINFVQFIRANDHKRIKISGLKIFRHLKPALRIFALNLTISIYVNLDSVMLGFLSKTPDESVGYYTAATKITKLVLGVVSSLQTIMIPRLSNFVENKMSNEFDLLVQRVYDIIITITLPLTVCICMMSSSLINIICGPLYTPAIVTLEIICPIILFISLSGIPCYQILYPKGLEMIAIAATGTGALINLLLNTLLIPSYAQNGAAISTVIAEATVLVTMFLYGKRHINIQLFSTHFLNCFIGSIVVFITIGVIRCMHLSDWLSICVMTISAFIVYALILWRRKDSVFYYFKDILSKYVIIKLTK